MANLVDRKSHAYKEGRRAGAADRPRASNPYQTRVGEWSDWDAGAGWPGTMTSGGAGHRSPL